MSLLCLGMNDQAKPSPPLISFGGGLGLFMDERGFDGYFCSAEGWLYLWTGGFDGYD